MQSLLERGANPYYGSGWHTSTLNAALGLHNYGQLGCDPDNEQRAKDAPSVTRLLFQFGANKDMMIDGLTPLMYAGVVGVGNLMLGSPCSTNTEAFGLLIEAGADQSIKCTSEKPVGKHHQDYNGKTVLEMVERESKFIRSTMFLFMLGAIKTPQDELDKAVFNYSGINFGPNLTKIIRTEWIRQCLKYGADPNRRVYVSMREQ